MVELIVENESLDLYPKEVISLTMEVNDLASIEDRQGNYSNKFTIPSTSRNNAALGYANELNFITGFKPTKSRGSVIRIDGIDIQRGFIQVEQYNQKDKEFNVSFFSGNTDWMDLISDKKLSDINLSKYNHVWDANSVVDSFSNTEGYIYPLINYGRLRNTSTNNVNIYSWLPAMYSHTLIREMFQDIDWKVEGSIFNDPIFLRHILPFSVKDLDIEKGSLDDLGVEADGVNGFFAGGVPIIYPNVVDYNDLDNYDPVTGIYTANGNTSVNVVATFNYNGSGTDRLEIRINGIVALESSTNFIEGSFGLDSGDTITITTNNGGIPPPAFDGGKLIITPNTSMIDGMGLPMSSTMPDVTQEEFIKTIFNQFGAVFVSDNISKTVYINKFTDIKNNIANAFDWTNKVDLSRDIIVDYTELVSNYNKSNVYGYSENKDISLTSQDSAEEVNPFGGNGSFVIDNDFLSKEDEVFESKFVSSTQVDSFNGRIKLMYIPRYNNGSSGGAGKNKPLPRCAIVAIDTDVSELFANDETSIDVTGSSVGTVSSNTIPYAYFDAPFTGVTSIDSINQNLSFGDNIIPKAHQNLLDTNYSDYIRILNNPRKVTAYFLLNERDIKNLDFLVPIYLGGELNNYFFLNKVSDYRPSDNGVTKVELVLIA